MYENNQLDVMYVLSTPLSISFGSCASKRACLLDDLCQCRATSGEKYLSQEEQDS
jgi:hypothetical protein